MACATDDPCLITEKSHPNTYTKLTEMHYSTEFHEAMVCQITPRSPHIPCSISKPSISSCKIYKILTTVI